MKTGAFYNLPASEYHAHPGVSASMLKKFHRATDAEARVELLKKVEPTPEMMLGTLSHHYILEPEKQLPGIIEQPETYGDGKKWTYAAKECKAWRDDQKAKGLLIQTRDDADRLAGILYSIRESKDEPAVYARELLSEGQSEVSIFLPPLESTHNLSLRCRLDHIPKGPSEVDVKIFRDISDRGFTNDAYDRGLHVQAWLYLTVHNTAIKLGLMQGEEKSEFKFIAIQNEAPFSVRVFTCSPAFIQRGGEDAMAYLARYAECTRTGVWKGYSQRETPLEIPHWIK